MTTRTLVFDSPFLLGFEPTRALIERATRAAAEGYPPYNVEQLSEDRMRITMAVAGFSPDQLQVTVEHNQLLVTGRREGEGREGSAYLHRGIAARGFQRTFVMADGMEVEGALLEHGLLHLDVRRPAPERSVKHIPIRTAG
ncbi:Hsp20 family protein [Caulobacter sp. S45]|uniref:Hsp20 family protein n=1 Tax=Caulobacter sp. S45 TaxID=1641861 RepID=UPI001575D347|nr:Hsp20 family protein [Caulobacter sp. S45]